MAALCSILPSACPWHNTAHRACRLSPHGPCSEPHSRRADVRSKRGPVARGQSPHLPPCSRCARPDVPARLLNLRLTLGGRSAIRSGVGVAGMGRTPIPVVLAPSGAAPLPLRGRA